MDALAQLIVWVNGGANALGEWALAPIATLPGWLSATLAAVVTGLLLLVVFKHTSHQRAIKAVRSDIKAHLLALKLFKDSAWVTLRAQGRLFRGAFLLLALAIVPMLVMALPVALLLGQLGLWYQARPLQVGEEGHIILTLSGGPDAPWPKVRLETSDAVEVLGRARVLRKREIVWKISARENGYHRLVFEVDGQAADKALAVGDGFMRVSTERPGWSWAEALRHPAEEPFAPSSPIQSIEIEYPPRASWISGTDTWVIYWFVASMVAALCFRRIVNVNL
jgi:hypothetical protein